MALALLAWRPCGAAFVLRVRSSVAPHGRRTGASNGGSWQAARTAAPLRAQRRELVQESGEGGGGMKGPGVTELVPGGSAADIPVYQAVSAT